MDKVTITLPSEALGEIDARVGDGSETGEYDSRSEAIRELTAKGLRYDERVSELETNRDRLQRELRARNSRESDVEEIVEYVDREKKLQERDRERRDAPAWRRAKWWLLGRSEG